MDSSVISALFETVDYFALSDNALVDANGIITVPFGPVDLDVLWFIDRATISTTSTTQTAFAMYARGLANVSDLADLSALGNADVADNASPVLITGGELIVCRWSGASAVDANGLPTRGTVRLQVHVVARKA